MPFRMPLATLGLILATSLPTMARDTPPKSGEPSARDYPTIQEAIKANPGRMIYVPSGDYEISETIRIEADRSGLFGPGRIIQTNPDRPIVFIQKASGVRLADVTLTRPAGKTETLVEAVQAIDCRELVLDGIQVIDNRTQSSAIEVRDCVAAQVRNCLVRNYQRVSIDDRTDNADLGYAFKCLIGTGILARECRGVLIQGNRVIEEAMVPTRELQARSDLGRYTKKGATPGRLENPKDWAASFTHNWLQGTAIHVGSPRRTDHAQVVGNYVENAGQGFDIHADHVTLSGNIVNDALIGMKAMHGSRHVLVVNNQFSKTSLWAIGLMPGASSQPAKPANGSDPATGPNVDGGSIIANNIISDFGLGQTRWIWGEDTLGCPIRFDKGQKPENPPLTDVIIQGNIVADTGRDGVLVDGEVKILPPRYRYAVHVESGSNGPVGLHFSNNILHPGTQGVSNVELKP